MSQDFDSILVL